MNSLIKTLRAEMVDSALGSLNMEARVRVCSRSANTLVPASSVSQCFLVLLKLAPKM